MSLWPGLSNRLDYEVFLTFIQFLRQPAVVVRTGFVRVRLGKGVAEKQDELQRSFKHPFYPWNQQCPTRKKSHLGLTCLNHPDVSFCSAFA
jgi:hypothetical protein